MYVKARVGKISFKYDNWLKTGLLDSNKDRVDQPLMKLQICWEDGRWVEEILIDLVGQTKAAEILMSNVHQKPGLDVFI